MFQKHKAREDKESISFSTKELQKRRAYCCIKNKKKQKGQINPKEFKNSEGKKVMNK